jgi:hypothetical protein
VENAEIILKKLVNNYKNSFYVQDHKGKIYCFFCKESYDVEHKHKKDCLFVEATTLFESLDHVMVTYKGKDIKILIDPEDHERVARYKWRVSPSGKISAVVDGINIILPKFILKLSKRDRTAFYINGDQHDCRKENLKECSVARKIKDSYHNKITFL